MLRRLLLLVFSTASCGPNPAAPTADAGPDARVPRCGDGIVDESEGCDDGERTGTIESLCPENCTGQRASLSHLADFESPYPGVRGVAIIDWGTSGVEFGLAVTSYDDTGIHVLQSVYPAEKRWLDLKVNGQPSSMAVIAQPEGPDDEIFWI